MALIQKLAKLAHHTFLQMNIVDRKAFVENLTKLVATTNLVKKSDVGLIPDYLTQSNNAWVASSGESPVTYIDIFRNDVFTLGIFILKQGARIPLHDHPGMYGIVKVLHGKLRIQSYSRTEVNGETKLIPVTKSASVYVSEDDAPGVLTPSDSNLHEIKADGGIAAFLDVLAPPYDSAHDCHYYKEVILKNRVSGANECHLVEIEPPDSYWTDTQPYVGPPVRSNDIQSSVIE